MHCRFLACYLIFPILATGDHSCNLWTSNRAAICINEDDDVACDAMFYAQIYEHESKEHKLQHLYLINCARTNINKSTSHILTSRSKPQFDNAGISPDADREHVENAATLQESDQHDASNDAERVERQLLAEDVHAALERRLRRFLLLHSAKHVAEFGALSCGNHKTFAAATAHECAHESHVVAVGRARKESPIDKSWQK